MKRCIVFLILFLTGFVFAAEVVQLPDLLNPDSITVDKDHIYITEGAEVYIYFLKDFTLKKKFGKLGEGPQEFKVFPGVNLRLNVSADDLILESIGKLSFFTRVGDFKKEIKISAEEIMLGRYKPIAKGFVGLGGIIENNEQFLSVNLYDSAVNKIKEIFKLKSSFGKPGQDIDPIAVTRFPFLYVDDNKIFVDDENGDIHVFNENGKEEKIVKYDYEKLAVKKADIDRYMDYFQSHPVYKRLIGKDKDKIKFPEYFPFIRSYHIADAKLYILTYRVTDEKKEFFIFDMNGKLIKQIFLPLREIDPLNLSPYSIKNGKLYQLLENEKTEKWELYVNEIK